MDTDSGRGNEAPDVETLVAQLQVKVEERRKAGFYPPGLEDDLSAHARRVLQLRHAAESDPDLRAHLRNVDEALPFDASRIPAVSGVPGGEMVHKAVAKVVSRQTSGALAEVEAFARPVRDALVAVVDALEGFMESVRADLGALYERQAVQERALVAATGRAPDGVKPPAE